MLADTDGYLARTLDSHVFDVCGDVWKLQLQEDFKVEKAGGGVVSVRLPANWKQGDDVPCVPGDLPLCKAKRMIGRGLQEFRQRCIEVYPFHFVVVNSLVCHCIVSSKYCHIEILLLGPGRSSR